MIESAVYAVAAVTAALALALAVGLLRWNAVERRRRAERELERDRRRAATDEARRQLRMRVGPKQ